MEITPQHADAEREGPGVDVEERLLLDGIALDAADVAPRNVQPPAAIEAHLADAHRALGDRTLMPASVAPDASTLDRLDEFGSRLGGTRLERSGESGHGWGACNECAGMGTREAGSGRSGEVDVSTGIQRATVRRIPDPESRIPRDR